MPKWLMTLLSAVIGVILERVSIEIIEELHELLDNLEERANKTRNTIDNSLVDFLREVLNIPGGE